MCSNINIVSETENGLVFKCKGCDNYQIVFNNLNFNFSDKEYFHFSNFIVDLDLGFYENKFHFNSNDRKIPLPIGHKNLTIILSIEEVYELKELFKHKKSSNYNSITLNEINYNLYMN